MNCLVVEDQQMFQELLVGMLEIHGGFTRVDRAGSAAEAIVLCSTCRPDLLVLDLVLPDGDSLSVARALRVFNPHARAIVLSSYASTFQRPEDLRDMITAVLDKGRAFQDLIKAVEVLMPDLASRRFRQTAALDQLSPREREVLRYLGEGLSSRQIADQLGLSVRTVETHRHTLGTKLGLNGAALVHQATLLSQRLPH